jgi:hypothetical protein
MSNITNYTPPAPGAFAPTCTTGAGPRRGVVARGPGFAYLMTATALGCIWLSYILGAIFAPDMVTGSQHQHFQIAAVIGWPFAAIAAGMVVTAALHGIRAKATDKAPWTMLGVGVGAIWLAVMFVTVFAPVWVTGTDPDRIPGWVWLGPTAGVILTWILCKFVKTASFEPAKWEPGPATTWPTVRSRSSWFAVLPVVALLAVFTAQPADGNGHGGQRWDVARDFRIAPNQVNPSPDRWGNTAAWSYLYSPTGEQDPAAYKLLPNFGTDKFDVQGLESWWGTNVSNNDDDLPAVGINATGHEVSTPAAPSVHWPAGEVLVHPWRGQPVVIGWRSPVVGSVFVTGQVSLAQQPNCGDGIDWAFDRGANVLAHGTIQLLQTNSWHLRTHLSRGESLYLVVAPRANIFCDSTLVDLTITRGQ